MGTVWFPFFNGLSNFASYLMAKAILVQELSYYYLAER